MYEPLYGDPYASSNNPKGIFGNFQHATKLYNDNYYQFCPKTKFLYHVSLNINPSIIQDEKLREQMRTVGLLVKSSDLPKFRIDTEVKNQYNRKKIVQTGMSYDPVNIVFHDDNVGITTFLWSLYYSYMFADSAHNPSIDPNITSGLIGGSFLEKYLPTVSRALNVGMAIYNASQQGITSNGIPAAYGKNTYSGYNDNKYRYGMDTTRSEPFFSSIQIYQLSRQQYQCFTLVNPVISAWSHDGVDQTSGTGTAQSSMTVNYESVFYNKGLVNQNDPLGFATTYYDHIPSPLGDKDRGMGTLFGSQGVVTNLSKLIGNIASGNAFDSFDDMINTAIIAKNTYDSANRMSSNRLGAEGRGLIKEAVENLSEGKLTTVNGTVFPTSTGLYRDNTPRVDQRDINMNPETVINRLNSASPEAMDNLIRSITIDANLENMPTNKQAAIDRIINEYNSGNQKVINIINSVGGSR